MLHFSAVLVIGLISIFESGQTWGYSYKFTAITTPYKLIQKSSTRSLSYRLQAAQIDTDFSEEPKTSGIPHWVAPFSTAAMGGLLFGSDIGCSSSVVRILGSKTAEFGSLSALELGQIASSSLFGFRQRSSRRGYGRAGARAAMMVSQLKRQHNTLNVLCCQQVIRSLRHPSGREPLHPGP